MSDFDRSFTEVIGLEGDYTNDPDDYGRETKYGISKRSYPELDIKNLTVDQAKEIYLRDYWNRMLLPQVKDHYVASEAFEQGVNLGRLQATNHIQMSIGMVASPVKVDGVIGPKTVAAMNGLGRSTQSFLKCMNGYQFIWYLKLVENDPKQKKFFVGWLRRISNG